MKKLTTRAAGYGRLVILEPTSCCGITWTSGETHGDKWGWTRTGECGKCGQRLVVGEEKLAATTCGAPMNLNPDGSTHAGLICCTLAYGHEPPHKSERAS